MKRLIIIVSVILFGLLPAADNHQGLSYLAETQKPLSLKCPEYLLSKNKIGETPKNNIPDSRNAVTNNSWYENAINKIRKDEYNISYNEESGTFQSPNESNNIRFTYHDNGFTAKARMTNRQLSDFIDKEYNNNEDWYVSIRFPDNPVSRNEYNTESKQEAFTFNGNKFTVNQNIACIEDEKMKVSYTNSPQGMRQDFVIRKKPDGDGSLYLSMNVNSNLDMSVYEDNVLFKSKSGQELLQYASLKAWDANHTVLDAYFKNLNSMQFAIVINDKDAVYPITIDPLSTSPDWTGPGFEFGDQFGYSVSSAGDINLDGYSDVIIGSPGKGKAFLYNGSPQGLSLTESWSYTCDQANSEFGFSVSSAGDVNGDQYPDVIIGAPYYSNGETKEGKVFVFYGSFFGLNPSPDWVYESNKENAETGYSVSGAGDFNNDGYYDVVIGLPHYSNSLYSDAQGRVYIFQGSPTGLHTTPDYIFKNILDGYTGLGQSVSCAGDVNGDGFSDVIIGEPYWPPPPASASGSSLESQGRAGVIYGISIGMPTGWNSEGESNHSLYGYSVSSAGDINNDGYSDIIIGAPNYYDGSGTTGKCYVFHGSPAGLHSTPDWTLSRQNDSREIDGFGRSVSGAEDINGDGYCDVIIGAHYTNWDNISDTTKSAAFVYYGSQDGLPGYRNWRYDTGGDRKIHIVVSNAGDVNGDGYKDVIIGNIGYSDIFPVSYALVFHGGAKFLPETPDWTSSCDQPMARYAYSVSGAGDVNGDGIDDVIIGAPNYENGQPDEGKVFVYYGSSSGLPVTANWTAEGNFEGALFGNSVSSAGDVNNDGFDDVIIGAPRFSSGSMHGGAFVFLGSSSGLMSVHNWYFGNTDAASEFGNSVSGAGDVNGDGFDDVIVGVSNSYLYDSHWIGALVFLGSASGIVPGNPAWSVSSSEQISFFCRSVSKAGDVNNDGFDDVIVGAFGYDSFRGKAIVYYGSPSRAFYAPGDWEAIGQNTQAFFGFSVSDAGDVNNDGISDIIVGAIEDWVGSGRAYIYHGSSAGPVFSKFLEGNIDESSWFGNSVSSAGDFNNDGFDDVIIGSRYVNNYGIYIYFGSPAGVKNFPDRKILYTGYVVSDAGDVNADGIDDVIAGNGGSNAVVYYGTGNIVTSFRITPRFVIAVRNMQYCFSGLLLNQFNQVIQGQRVDYIIKGANPDSVSVISDDHGIAKLCYAGSHLGYDTIKGKAGGKTDKVIVKWDYPLPVKLASFTSSVSGRDVVLTWSTTEELNNSGFYIERSSGENNWVNTGFIKGSGTISEPVSYSFTDKNLPAGNYKYRLKQSDFNGSFEYFELNESVSIGIPGKYSLYQNYPNPFNPVTTIKYDVPASGIVVIKIYDMLGRELITLVNEFKTAGYYEIKYNASSTAGGLSSGVYFYRMSAGNFTDVKKFVVLK